MLKRGDRRNVSLLLAAMHSDLFEHPTTHSNSPTQLSVNIRDFNATVFCYGSGCRPESVARSPTSPSLFHHPVYFQFSGLSIGRISISLGSGIGFGQRFTQATASSISFTSHSQNPATKSRAGLNGPSITCGWTHRTRRASPSTTAQAPRPSSGCRPF
jgi:hypothetical protein